MGTIVTEADNVELNGKPVRIEKQDIYHASQTPQYVTTVRDPQGRKTVMDLVQGIN